jgi:hypothetical protein
MNDQELTQLSREILAWLRTTPTDEDALAYVNALEPHERKVIFRVVEDFLPSFLSDLRIYLQKNKLDAFFHMDVGDLLYYLSLFSLYSAESVKKKLKEDKILFDDTVDFPIYFSEWAAKQLELWRSVTLLVGATEFIQQRVLLGSFEQAHIELSQLELLQSQAKKLLELLGESLQKDSKLSVNEQSQIRDYLHSLKFIPDESIESFFDDERLFELQLILFRVFSVIDVLLSKDVNLPSNILLLEQLRITYGKRFVNRLEALRLVESGQVNANANEVLYAQIEDCFSLENIQSQQVANAIFKLSSTQKDVDNFIDTLYRFIGTNPRIDLILSPVSSHYLLDTLEILPVEKLDQYCSEIVSDLDDDRFKQYVPGILRAIHYVVTSFKRTSNV